MGIHFLTMSQGQQSHFFYNINLQKHRLIQILLQLQLEVVGLLFKRQTSSAAMPLISEARESHADIFLLSFFTNINSVFDFFCVKHLETYILVDFVTNE